MHRLAEVRRAAKACRSAVLWAAVVLSVTGEACAGLIAFTYHGENTRSPGETAGGYFFLDPDRLPNVRFDPFWRATVGQWDLSGLQAVNYKSLADPNPVRASGNEVWVSNSGPISQPVSSSGHINFGPYTPERQIRIVTQNGPPVSAGQTLGSFIEGRSWNEVQSLAGFSIDTRIVNPTVSPFTIQDIFKNPFSLRQPEVDGPTIRGEFTPHVTIGSVDIPIQLEDVARLFGVDHFNWIQTITAPPGVDVGIDLDGDWRTNDRVSSSKTHVDPIESVTSTYVHTNNDNTRPEFRDSFTLDPAGPDTAPYYWNEVGGGDYAIAFNTLPDAVLFEDSPRMADLWDPGATKHFYFDTQLVGVRADGTAVPTGLGFTWESNSRFRYPDPDLIIAGGARLTGHLFTRDEPGLPTVHFGGISNIRVYGPADSNPSPVPEPSSLALLGTGLLGLVGYRARRRGRAASAEIE